MQFSFAKSCLLALAAASSVLAQTAKFDPITSPASAGTVIPAGKAYKITWETSPAPLDGDITIQLLQGASPSTLELGEVIAKAIDASTGSYSWEVPTTIPKFATYGFQLSLDSDPKTFQYSFPFAISGLGASASASSSTSSTSSLTSASSGSSTSSVSTVSVTGVSTSLSLVTSTTKAASASTTLPVPVPTTVAANATSTSGSGPFSNGTANATSTSSSVPTQSANAAMRNAGAGVLGAAMVVMGFML